MSKNQRLACHRRSVPDSKVVMRSFAQLQAMDAAWHSVANAFQKLGCARNQEERDQAFDMYHSARAAYQAAKEGHVDEPGWDANGAEV